MFKISTQDLKHFPFKLSSNHQFRVFMLVNGGMFFYEIQVYKKKKKRLQK